MHDTTTAVPWRGVNHLALITADMDATVRFWHGVMGAELVATLRTPTFLHYFFRIGGNHTIAFFQYLDDDGAPRPTDVVVKPAGVYDRRAGHFDHLSLDVSDDAALLELRRRVLAAGSEVTEIVDHKIFHSIYFTDPNGIALEASCWVTSPPSGPDRFADPLFFADDEPVPAVAELIAGGLTSVPTTRLS